MKIVFYSIVLNHHQAPVADAFYDLIGDDYKFVELRNCNDTKGATIDYSKRPYLIRSWRSPKEYKEALDLARSADVCVFGGAEALPFLKERMKRNLLSFDMGERWLKKGLKNLFSPYLLKMYLSYWIGGWQKKSLYKLCSSAFAARDHSRLSMYKEKCYKWGYFINVSDNKDVLKKYEDKTSNIKILWCGRFIDWKHPELAISLAEKLKKDGYKFHLDMIGDGVLKDLIQKRIGKSGLSENLTLCGDLVNQRVVEMMRNHHILIMTSDQEEGWGVVVNEAMGNGCLIVGSNEAGAVPFLVQDSYNGMIFKSRDLNSLYDKVVSAIKDRSAVLMMVDNGISTIRNVWSPQNAAANFLTLVENLNSNKEVSIINGPCSKAGF